MQVFHSASGQILRSSTTTYRCDDDGPAKFYAGSNPEGR